MPSTPAFAAIDFGTSNSTVGIAHNGRAELLEPEPGHLTAPTALFFSFAPGVKQPLAGHAAVHAYLQGEEGRFMRGLKGVLGTNLFPETTQIRSQRITFAQIIGTYLGWLKSTAETHLGRPLTHLLLGRPVHFLTNQPEADAEAEEQLRTIAQTLGLSDIAFLYEPLAAAYHHEQSLHKQELALILDIGGGTTDLTVMQLGPQLVSQKDRTGHILATHGLRLGGTDADKAFAMAQVMPLFGYGSMLTGDSGAKGLTMPGGYYHQLTTWHRIQRLYDKTVMYELHQLQQQAAEPGKVGRLIRLLENHDGHRSMFAVEESKIALSSTSTTHLNLGWLEAGLALPLTQSNLQTALSGWLAQLQTAITQTLHKAQITPAQLGTVFLTGGPSAMPLVQQAVQQMLPNTPLIRGNQLTSVGHGLTLAAQRLFS